MSWVDSIRQRFLDELARRLMPVLEERLASKVADRISPEIVADVSAAVSDRLVADKPWLRNIFKPSMDVYRSSPDAPFMAYSTCSSRDFFHPEFKRITSLIEFNVAFHRKVWEWVFIIHHAFRMGMVGEGRRGLAFAVGQEMLPAMFVAHGVSIHATDAPQGVGEEWKVGGNQFSGGIENLPSWNMERSKFLEKVTFSPCDMNDIDPALKDFDFCWSSCALEHLGSLRRGFDFMINSLKTVKIGGVSIHTTELNLSSNDETVEAGPTVLYRKRDIEEFILELRSLGHEVGEFRVAPDSLVIDGYVDTPPYSASAHLKLSLSGYACTSAGLVIRRGR